MPNADPNHSDDAAAVSARWEKKHLVRRFEASVREQEDLLFGIALFFEGIQFLYAGQEDMIETYRKELRNVIQSGRQRLDEAHRLLEAAQRSPSQISALQNFSFPPCHGTSHPKELEHRAKVLVAAYASLYPRRPRTAPLTDDEVVAMIAAASSKIDLAPENPR